MFGRIVVLMMLVACSSAPPPAPEKPAPRVSIARRMLPPDVAAHVPAHGVYIAGGGEKSPAFRVVVDTDAKTIYTGTATAGTSPNGKMAEERTRELTPRNEQHLMKLCADAWSEPSPREPPEPVEGYDEYMVIADGEEVFFLHVRGPIKRPAAMKAIEALRAAAAL